MHIKLYPAHGLVRKSKLDGHLSNIAPHVNNCCPVRFGGYSRVSDVWRDIKMELVIVVFSTETQWAHHNASPCNFKGLNPVINPCLFVFASHWTHWTH